MFRTKHGRGFQWKDRRRGSYAFDSPLPSIFRPVDEGKHPEAHPKSQKSLEAIPRPKKRPSRRSWFSPFCG